MRHACYAQVQVGPGYESIAIAPRPTPELALTSSKMILSFGVVAASTSQHVFPKLQNAQTVMPVAGIWNVVFYRLSIVVSTLPEAIKKIG